MWSIFDTNLQHVGLHYKHARLLQIMIMAFHFPYHTFSISNEHWTDCSQTYLTLNKQTNKQTNKQGQNKQGNKQRNKQTNKQANKQTQSNIVFIPLP